MYKFMGNLRLQFYFETPNICATFLVMTSMVSIGLLLYFMNKKERIAKGFQILLYIIILLQEIWISLTYSRGGYVAFCFGILFVYYFSRKKTVLFFLLAFMGVITFIANGVTRVKSISEIGSGSIMNRLLLWEGGVGIIANNWLTGVSIKPVGKLYTDWYQPLWLKEIYATLINDYLTIGALYGIFSLFIILFVLFVIFQLGLKVIKLNSKWSKIVIGLLAAILTYSISAIFSTFYDKASVNWLFLLMFISLVVVILSSYFSKQLKVKISDIIFPGIFASLICIVILSLGIMVNYKLPYKYKYYFIPEGDISLKICVASPKKNILKKIVYLFNSKNQLMFNGERHIIRPLVLKGYEVIAMGVDSGIEGLNHVKLLLDNLPKISKTNQPIFCIAEREGGKHVIVAASTKKSIMDSLRGIITLNSPLNWPFKKISPIQHIAKITIPILIINTQNVNDLYLNDIATLKRIDIENNLKIDYQIIKTDDHYFANNIEKILTEIEKLE